MNELPQNTPIDHSRVKARERNVLLGSCSSLMVIAAVGLCGMLSKIGNFSIEGGPLQYGYETNFKTDYTGAGFARVKISFPPRDDRLFLAQVANIGSFDGRQIVNHHNYIVEITDGWDFFLKTCAGIPECENVDFSR